MSALDRRSFLNVANDHWKVASQARTGQQLRTQLCELGLTMLMSAHDFPVWIICCARSFSISSHCDWRHVTVQQFCGDKSASVASGAKNRCHWFGCIFFRFLIHQLCLVEV